MNDETKIAFLKARGWSESCLYDDRFNPPDKSFYQGEKWVFTLEESYALALERLKRPGKEQFERAARICRDLTKEFGEDKTSLIRHAFMVYFGREAPDEFDQNVFREAALP